MHTIKTHPSTPYLKSALQSSSKACRWSRALSYRPRGAESPEKRTAMHHKNTKHMGQSIIIYIIIITWGGGGHMKSGRLQGRVCVRRGQSSPFYFFPKEDNYCFLAVRHRKAAVPGESDPASDAPGDE